MNSYTAQGIVLSRTDFGEADRIVTFLTPAHGKVTTMAKGVRKTKSKLAGGIELFSVSDLTLLTGRGEIQTLMSTRLAKHYGHIVKDVARAQAGFDFIKLINKATEEEPEEAYFNLLKRSYESLNDSKLDPTLVRLWFNLQLLKLAGHSPNLRTDAGGRKLSQAQSYSFDLETMRFEPQTAKQGDFTTGDVKFLRVGLQAAGPGVLQRVDGCASMANDLQPLLQSMLHTFFRL